MSDTNKRIKNYETLTRIGQVLRAERERQGLTQAQASKRVRGLRQATISKIERGGDATLDTLISYATALKIEMAFVSAGQSNAGVISASLPSISAKLSTPSSLLEAFADLKDDSS
jgi:transcriptional regulator with XRE-family HTH domain